MTELLPCPFCGDEPLSGSVMVGCQNKDCPLYRKYFEDWQWNTRAASPSEWQVPEGWKLVPIEPTEAMNIAAHTDARKNAIGDVIFLPGVYKAMLLAVPPIKSNSGWQPIEEDFSWTIDKIDEALARAAVATEVTLPINHFNKLLEMAKQSIVDKSEIEILTRLYKAALIPPPNNHNREGA